MYLVPCEIYGPFNILMPGRAKPRKASTMLDPKLEKREHETRADVELRVL
jgi:hypothetical protein